MEFYTIHSINMQVSREEVLNHRRFQNGKLMPGDTFRGYFLAKGDNPIPDDLKRDSNQRRIEARLLYKIQREESIDRRSICTSEKRLCWVPQVRILGPGMPPG